jgi:hypothetical protein
MLTFLPSQNQPWVSNPNNYVQKAVAVKFGSSVFELYAGDPETGPRVHLVDGTYTIHSLFTTKGNSFHLGNMVCHRVQSDGVADGVW